MSLWLACLNVLKQRENSFLLLAEWGRSKERRWALNPLLIPPGKEILKCQNWDSLYKPFHPQPLFCRQRKLRQRLTVMLVKASRPLSPFLFCVPFRDEVLWDLGPLHLGRSNCKHHLSQMYDNKISQNIQRIIDGKSAYSILREQLILSTTASKEFFRHIQMNWHSSQMQLPSLRTSPEVSCSVLTKGLQDMPAPQGQTQVACFYTACLQDRPLQQQPSTVFIKKWN